MNPKTLFISVESDLKDYGLRDDGTPFVGEVFYVSIENSSGDRWRHHRHFDGVHVFTDAFGEKMFFDIRDNAKRCAEKLQILVSNADAINLNFWEPTRPAYGSVAYIAHGAADDIAWEMEQG